MKKLYIVAAILLLLVCSKSSNAQEGSVHLGVKAGYSAPFGGFAAESIEADHSFKKIFSLAGGVQYNSIGKRSVELRPSYFHDFNCGRLSAEILMHYNNISSVNNYALGGGLSFKGISLFARLGYYYRVLASNKSYIKEPFNLYYELGISCLPMIQKWDLNLMITNCEIFELERHFQLSYIIQGWYYPIEKIGITLGVSYKPAGMFNMTTDRYRISSKLGVSYRW